MWMQKHTKQIALILIIAFMGVMLLGCGGQNSADNGTKPGTDQQPQQVTLLYVEWACATATTHVAADILENEMGYQVELIPVSAALMYEGLANDDGDGMLCAWLPITHEEYMNKLGSELVDLGPNMEGAKLALTVPEYVEINSIEEMNEVKDKFNGEIIGIDPGAGIMGRAEQAIEDYNLDYTLMEGSDATMVAALKTAIDRNKWIVVTGWIPHWKFAAWDLKTLEDPKLSFGEDETINTLVRTGLQADMPEVYEFLDNFHWTPDDLSRAMVLAEENDNDSKAAASQWVEENQELVQSWLPATK